MKAISIYRANSKTIYVTVSGLNLSGYTATLTAKSDFGETSSITKAGVIDEAVITFSLVSDDTDVTEGSYVYDIVVTKDDDAVTLVQSTLTIKQSVTYS